MAISRYSENYCYDVIYDYNSFSQMSQAEMTYKLWLAVNVFNKMAGLGQLLRLAEDTIN